MENLNEVPSASAENTAPAETAPEISAEIASTNSTKNPNNAKIIVIALTALLVVALGALSYFVWKGQTGQIQKPSGLTPESASKAAIDYINKYFAGSGALASISDLSKEETTGLYKFTLELQGQKLNAYVSSDGKMLFPQDPIDLTKSPDSQEEKATTTEAETKAQTAVDGNFNQINDAQVCQENGKPIVYFFGSESCPHCIWEKPVISAVAKKFGSAISYHENVDNGKEMDVFNKYSTGSIPTIVIGCKYYRVGSGESAGEQSETATLTKLICDITGNQPAAVCGK